MSADSVDDQGVRRRRSPIADSEMELCGLVSFLLHGVVHLANKEKGIMFFRKYYSRLPLYLALKA